MAEYAIIDMGGRQYRVAPGDIITVERMDASVGQELTLDKVLMVRDADRVVVGNPVVAGARAVARVLEHGRGRKVFVFKYKPKVNYRRRFGHRQPYTRLAIERLELDR